MTTNSMDSGGQRGNPEAASRAQYHVRRVPEANQGEASPAGEDPTQRRQRTQPQKPLASTRQRSNGRGRRGYVGGMTEMQAQFVEEYLKDMNARQAAIRAGYAADAAHVTGSAEEC